METQNLYYGVFVDGISENAADNILNAIRGNYFFVAEELVKEAYKQSDTAPWYLATFSRDIDNKLASAVIKIDSKEQLLDIVIGRASDVEDAEGPSNWSFITEDEYNKLLEEYKPKIK